MKIIQECLEHYIEYNYYNEIKNERHLVNLNDRYI